MIDYTVSTVVTNRALGLAMGSGRYTVTLQAMNDMEMVLLVSYLVVRGEAAGYVRTTTTTAATAMSKTRVSDGGYDSQA